MRALGVDAAGRRGWAGVVVDDHGFAQAHLAATLRGLIESAERDGEVAAIGVDRDRGGGKGVVPFGDDRGVAFRR